MTDPDPVPVCWIVAIPTGVEGYTIVGPFPGRAQAQTWCDDKLLPTLAPGLLCDVRLTQMYSAEVVETYMLAGR